MSSTVYSLAGLHCAACVRRVTEALTPHATRVVVSLSPMQATLEGVRADLATLQSAVRAAGAYQLMPMHDANPAAREHAPQPAPTPASPVTFMPVKKAREQIARTALTATSEQTGQSHNTASATPAQPPAASEFANNFFATYRPLLLLGIFILTASLLAQLGTASGNVTAHETMRYFMAGAFLAFAFFKLLDLRAFADAYAGYDLLAQRWHGWGYVYPFVELSLGMAYLANVQPTLTNCVTVIVMGFSAIGVIIAVANRKAIRCACLGAVFNLPMSRVTIIEDVGMVAMAAMALV